MDLPGAIQEEEEPKIEEKKRRKSTSLAESRGLGLTSLPTAAIRRQSRASEASKVKVCPQYTVRIWEYGLTGWLEKNHFCAGLQVDLKIGLQSCQDLVANPVNAETEKDVRLPSTSLSALTQLQESLKSPSGLLLDIADCRSFQFTELFSAMLSEMGKDIPGSIVQEAELSLNEHPYVTKEGSPSKDSAVGESMDIFLCSTAGTGLIRPVLALARLKMDGVCFAADEGTGEMRFCAVVLCDTNSEKGRSLARALATTFMDEEFVSTARSTPRAKPEMIREALRVYLAKLTIVPTVKLNKVAAAAGPMSPVGAGGKQYTLENSLVSGIQRRMSLVTPQEAFDISKRDLGFERQHSNESENGEMAPTTYHIEVDRYSNHESGWQMEKCLRQGLEVDFTLNETLPHLPHVSCFGLEEVRRLAVPQNVAIDVEAPGVVEATLNCLKASGLPLEALEEVSKALKVRLENGCEDVQDNMGSELVNPNDGDEAALVLMIFSKSIKESSAISGAFIRSKVVLPLRSDHPPARFIIALVGHKTGASNLTDVGESLAALTVDEDLISKMARAATKEEFAAAFDSRLGEIVLLPHAHVHAKRNIEDEMLLSPKGAGSPKSGRKERSSNATSPTKSGPVQTISSSSLGIQGTKSYVNKDGHIVTNVKSDIGFDHMHNHGPADDLRSNVAIGVRRTWRAVAWAQKYALPLVIGVCIAMVWMNIDEKSYHSVTHDPIVEGFQILGHDVSMHFLVNDIFMCFFFGLAIKEVTEALLPGGSLSPIRRATNPLMATLGGVVGPVAAYVIFVVIFYEATLFNGILCEVDAGGDTHDAHRRLLITETHNATAEQEYRDCGLRDFINGWGVPTATDISLAWMFAIQVFGAGHPAINYLLLLAIADDALGMAIIAIAYPDPVHPVQPVWFCLVLGGTLVAFLLRFAGVKYWTPYVFIAGPISWFGLILAQVHPALALVCIVPFMPATHDHGHDHDDEMHAKSEVRFIGSFIPRAKSEILQRAAQEFLARRGAPLHAFEHHCKLFVDFGMFFFGVANAGVKVDGIGTLTVATFLALILGKTLGIVFFAMLAHALGFLLPLGLTVVDLFAMSALGGVGLTVALFVSNEAFTDTGLQSQAKMGAVFSVASALLAFCIKYLGDKLFHPPKTEAEEETEVEMFSDDEAEAEEWLDVVAMNDIMQVLWTQRKYQARGTDLNIKRLARSVSKQNLNWQRSDAPLGFSRQTSREGSLVRGGSKESQTPSSRSQSLRRTSDEDGKSSAVHPIGAFGNIPE